MPDYESDERMKIVGLMSGTSADGLDIALCEVDNRDGHLYAEVLCGTMIPYNASLRQRILTACDPERSNTPLISALHTDLGQFTGEQVRDFLHAHAQDADLIASHGQTIWHAVADDGTVTSTLQIGSSAHIAEVTGITTISDFRSRDVAAGGQGAPLTAYVDALLLRHPTKTRAIQNIGGIGNVTILSPDTAPADTLLAFDTGAGNVLIDSAMSILSEGQQTYDQDGAFAGSGKVDTAWLEILLDHPYYHRPPPKTTGRELFSPSLAEQYVFTGRERGLADADIMATLTALTAYSIAHAYQQHVPVPVDEIVVGGGGVHNKTLMNMVRALCAPATLCTHDDLHINSDYKEALVFAVLGYLTWHNRVGTSPQQTGARHGSVLGNITPSTNYASLVHAREED